MVKALSKSILTVLLLTVIASPFARAEVKLYRYDGKLPFIRMMLGMMDAMGVIDRVPANGAYGRYGGSPSSPWSSLSNPYSRALAMRGINPGSSSLYNNPYMSRMYGSEAYSSIGNNPFARSPWLQSPWSQYGDVGPTQASPLWGSPDWGVLPTNKYSLYGEPYYGGSYWTESELDGWVDEPWESSEWNSDADRSAATSPVQSTQQSQSPQQLAQQSPQRPLVQNFNFAAPESSQPGAERVGQEQFDQGWFGPGSYDQGQFGQGQYEQSQYKQGQYGQGQYGQGPAGNDPSRNVDRRSPLAKLAPPRQPAGAPSQYSNSPPVNQQRRPSPLSKHMPPPMSQPGQQPGRQTEQQAMMQNKSSQQHRGDQQQGGNQQVRRTIRQKPCVTEFCGLKKPNLNGLWVAENGELLGVNREKFLWSDGTERYLTGVMKVQNEYLLARVEGNEKLMRFKYKLAGDHLLTMQPNGVIREFIRMSPEQYYNLYGGL